jgi:epoxide hydrolase-like predicted phosphatase
MTINGIIFDFGGVIMRTEDRTPRLNLAEKHGISIEAIEQLVFSNQTAKMAEVGSISALRHWQEVARTLQASDEEIPTIRQQFFAGDCIDRDLLVYIQSLRGKYHTALLSNAFDDLRAELTGQSPAPSAYHISNADHLLDIFDEVIISAEVGLAKPDRRIYQCMADRLHLSIGECVFIDDYPPNIDGACLAGMNVVRFMSPGQARQDLEAILKSNHSKE